MEPLTLGDHLAANRAGVSAAQFEASRGLDPRQGSSWAVWGNTTHDLSLFDDSEAVAPRLRKDVVLIGANFGLGGDVEAFMPFQNFHAKGSGGDSKLRGALAGTVLQGAFLTDLVKNYPTKYANGLRAQLERGTLDVETYVGAGFRAEQEALELSEKTLYIPMGENARELWELLVDLGAIPETQRVFHREYGSGPQFRGKPVLNLTHYSSAVSMELAVEALLAQPVLG